MPRLLLLLSLAFAEGALAATAAPAKPAVVVGTPAPAAASTVSLVERATPAVLRLTGYFKRSKSPVANDEFFQKFFPEGDKDREKESQQIGSATVVDAQAGWVLSTDYNLRFGSGETAERFELYTEDGRRLAARVLATSAEHGLTLLQVTPDALVAVPLAETPPRPGEEVLALGYAGPLKKIVPTLGISSGSMDGQNLGSGEFLGELLATDAYYHLGFSGGPLLNSRGELVGIHSQILARGSERGGPGFAIGLTDIRYVIDGYRRHGRLLRPRLGLQGQDRRTETGEVSGAIVTVIEPDSPAAVAGLLSGDVVLMADGRPIQDFAALSRAVSYHYPGEVLPLDIWRSGQTLKRAATLGEFPAETAP